MERRRLTSQRSRGSFSALTECRWSGISCCRSGLRHKRAGNSDGWSPARIRSPTNHDCRGLARGVRARTVRRSGGAPRHKPDYCLNVGVTWPGLVALEIEERVSTLSFKSFDAFIEGAARRAESVGETGASSPENWVGGFGTGEDHVLVTLHTLSPEAMNGYTDRLCAWFPTETPFGRSGARTVRP